MAFSAMIPDSKLILTTFSGRHNLYRGVGLYAAITTPTWKVHVGIYNRQKFLKLFREEFSEVIKAFVNLIFSIN